MTTITPPNPIPDADAQAIFTECRSADANGDTIGETCVRAIAAAWHGGSGTRAYTFAVTGTITDTTLEADTAPVPERFRDGPGRLWWELFGHPAKPGWPVWAMLDRDWFRAAAMFDRYLSQWAKRGAQQPVMCHRETRTTTTTTPDAGHNPITTPDPHHQEAP
jgi:hypothetical protein